MLHIPGYDVAMLVNCELS